MTNVTVGTLGDYTFKQGFSNEKRSGFINRRPGKVTNGCITPSLQPNEVIYFEVDKAQYKAMDKGSDFILQCVRSADPGAGAIRLNGSSNGTSDKYLGTSHMKLHCGNDQGVTDCATGTNSARAKAYTADMKRKGKYGVSFLARPSDVFNAPTEKLYCQYYNKRTGKSLVAFEYLSVAKNSR